MAHRGFSRSPQRQFVWSDIITHLSLVGISAAKVAAGTSALGVATGGGITLIRTRGNLSVHFDPTTVADVVDLGIGLGIFSSDAFATGQAAMPGPLSDADYDWVYHNVFVIPPASTNTETETSLNQNMNVVVDSKAMRKMKPNQTLGWIAEASVLNGGGSWDLGVSARHLFKLG